MPKIVNTALKAKAKAKAWTFEAKAKAKATGPEAKAKAIKFGLEAPRGQGLASRTTSLNRVDVESSDLDPRWLEVESQSQSLIANNSIQNYHTESPHCSLFNSLNISQYDHGRRTDDWFQRSVEVKCQVGQRSQWKRLPVPYNLMILRLIVHCPRSRR